MAKVIQEKSDSLLVVVSKGEVGIYVQTMVERINDAIDEEAAGSVLLVLMNSLTPLMKYALPKTQEAYNLLKKEMEEAGVEDIPGEEIASDEEQNDDNIVSINGEENGEEN